MKGLEVAKSVAPCLSMFRKDTLQLNRDLDEDRRIEPNRLALHRWDWHACTCANRDINNPVGMADRLMVSKLGYDFPTACSGRESWALRNKVPDDD